MDNITLALQNGSTDQNLIQEFNDLANQVAKKNANNPFYYRLLIDFGVTTKNAAYAIQNFEEAVKLSKYLDSKNPEKDYRPVNVQLFKNLYELCLKRDNFKGLGLLINYAEEMKLKLSSLDLSLFKDSLDYYLNQNFKLSNVMIFMKYYTYVHECLFREFDLTPKSLKNVSPAELLEYSHFLFPYNSLVDTKDVFSYLVKKVGDNRIIDKHTKQDMMERFINYFTSYTIPFMDTPQLVNNFIRENDVAQYCALRFEEPNSFKNVMNLAQRYNDRTIFTEFMLKHLQDYQAKNDGRLPPSYTRENVMEKLEELQNLENSEPNSKIHEKVYEPLLLAMKQHKMIDEMKQVPHSLRNHYITEAICSLPNDGSPDFYSSKIKELFPTKKDKATSLYSLSMMKGLLKEGDVDAAFRVLDEGERAQNGKKKAIEEYYLKIYNHCFSDQNTDERTVNFFPDVIKEVDQKIQDEANRAGEVSQYEKNRVLNRYNKDKVHAKKPVSYSDFKKRHFNMVKTMKNYTQQMMLMKMVRAAIDNSDYRKVNDLFNYLLVNKEEEQMRKAIRSKIETYAKTYNPTRKVTTPAESRDPLRVLFKQVRNPNDDINTLVNKYILLVPELKIRLDRLRDRKNVLQTNIKNMIKERDALYLTDNSLDMIQYFEDKDLENLDFDTDSYESRKAIDNIHKYYEKLMCK